jgi:hypothetical protein
MDACHGPGGRLDNRWPENLRYGSRSQNLGADKHRDGTMAHAKLDEAAVLAFLARRDIAELDRDRWRTCGHRMASAVQAITRLDTWRRSCLAAGMGHQAGRQGRLPGCPREEHGSFPG